MELQAGLKKKDNELAEALAALQMLEARDVFLNRQQWAHMGSGFISIDVCCLAWIREGKGPAASGEGGGGMFEPAYVILT